MSGYIPSLTPISPTPSSMFPSSLPLSRHFDLGPQYGVSALSGLASAMPVVGPLLGAGMNMIGTAMQNQEQRQFFSDFMSPQARMSQMRAAGINPNAAAQGISGSSAPQMNAAAPTSAFSSLGEALGNSVNTALTAENIAAQTKNLEVQAEGQDLQNMMTEVELGIKPDMLTAELEETRAHASELRQTVSNLKKEIEKYDQEIRTLKSDENYNVAKEGQVAFDNRLKEAQTARERAEAALAEANKELVNVEKDIQEKERDNWISPEERITLPIETAYNVDPIHADFTDVHKAIESLDAAIDQCYDNERILFEKFKNGEISDKEYIDGVHENDRNRDALRLAKKSSERAYDKLSYKNGYHTWWQDNASSLINSVSNLTGTLGSSAIHVKGMEKFGSKNTEFRRKIF